MSAMEEPLLRDVERSSTSATGLQLLLEPTLPADFPEPHAGATFAQTAFNLQNVFMGTHQPAPQCIKVHFLWSYPILQGWRDVIT